MLFQHLSKVVRKKRQDFQITFQRGQLLNRPEEWGRKGYLNPRLARLAGVRLTERWHTGQVVCTAGSQVG